MAYDDDEDLLQLQLIEAGGSEKVALRPLIRRAGLEGQLDYKFSPTVTLNTR